MHLHKWYRRKYGDGCTVHKNVTLTYQPQNMWGERERVFIAQEASFILIYKFKVTKGIITKIRAML